MSTKLCKIKNTMKRESENTNGGERHTSVMCSLLGAFVRRTLFTFTFNSRCTRGVRVSYFSPLIFFQLPDPDVGEEKGRGTHNK